MPTDEYLSGVLYHFWPQEPLPRAMSIFRSIVERGFLMSRSTGELVDHFQVYGDTPRELVYLPQNARVCFTDIPEDKVFRHAGAYGRFAVGFSRSTIMEWGGCPVWYLPNHVVPGTLQGQTGEIVKGVSRGAKALSLFAQLLDEGALADKTFLTKARRPMAHAEVRAEVVNAREAILHACTFLKQMSSVASDDHRFLYEREWRIARGVSFGNPEEVYRSPTDGEVEELTTLNPRWKEPLATPDGAVEEMVPIVRTFRFFNGLPGHDRVSQRIEVVLVPNEEAREAVHDIIGRHADRFRHGGPRVSITPTA